MNSARNKANFDRPMPPSPHYLQTMFSRAIVRLPGANYSEGLTQVNLGTPDYALALRQHALYCETLEQCGLQLTRLEADERYPDSTFVEDTAVLTKLCAFITRPGATSRRGEVTAVRETLAQFFPEIHSLHEPGTLDGGDICEAGDHFFIGISERTNEAGAQQLAELLTANGYTSSFVDIRDLKSILHLKSGVAHLGDNRLVVTEALRNRHEFRKFELVKVSSGEEYAANCVRVNDCVLIAAGYPEFARTLASLGYQTIALEMSEFQKMDGGLSCLSVRF